MDEYEKPYREASAVKSVLLFLFTRKAFAEASTRHDISLMQTTAPDLRAHYVGDALLQHEIEVRKQGASRAVLLRRSLKDAFDLVVVSAAAGLTLGWLCQTFIGTISPSTNAALQAIGAGLILWVTVWQLSPDAQTMCGETLVERVHGWLFRSLYVFGTFLFFVAYTWSA